MDDGKAPQIGGPPLEIEKRFFFGPLVVVAVFVGDVGAYFSLSPERGGRKKQKYLDRVVDSLREVVSEAGNGAREVERRRRRVDGGAGDSDGRERVVGRVLQARSRDVPVDERVCSGVENRLALRGKSLLLGRQASPRGDRVCSRVDGGVDRGEVFDGRRDDDGAVLLGDFQGGRGDLALGSGVGLEGGGRRRGSKEMSEVSREQRERRERERWWRW